MPKDADQEENAMSDFTVPCRYKMEPEQSLECPTVCLLQCVAASCVCVCFAMAVGVFDAVCFYCKVCSVSDVFVAG